MKTGNSTAPILVYGSLRSGTTLLRLMLDRHPKLSCPGESDFIFDHLKPLDSRQRYDLAELQADRIYRNFEKKYADSSSGAPTPQGFVDRIAESKDITPVLMLHRGLSRALDEFPEMRVIHLLRDPRDVARSSIGMGWAGHVYYGVDHWMQTEDEWQRCKDRFALGQVLELTYEDLILHPEEKLEKIVGLAGQDYDPDMLEYDGDSTYTKPDPNLTMQWKRKQTAQEIGLVEAKIGNRLSLAGYTQSEHARIQPSPAMKARLWLQNKRGVWKFRVSRFGFRDPFVAALSKRLGLSSINRNAQRRIDEKTIQYLK